MTGTRNAPGRRVVSASPSFGSKLDRPRAQQGATNFSGSRVYVGNLKYEVSWQDLKDHMRSAGDVVRADVLTDPSGRSKGCGLVEYASPRDARHAIAKLNNTELNGRLIFVREDREAPGGPPAIQLAKAVREQPMHVNQPRLGVSKCVYVGNLSYDVEWQDLKDLMRTAGEVVHANVLKEPNGRSKGCAVVEFASVRDANNAIVNLNDAELKGRNIFIREDREANSSNPNSSDRHKQASAYTDSSSLNTNRLYVGNLDYKSKWFDLKDHFKQAGNVTRADVALESDGVRSRGYGIVEFATPEEAAHAVQLLNNSHLNGREIFVREDREEQRRL